MARIYTGVDEMRINRAIKGSPRNQLKEQMKARLELMRRIGLEESWKETEAFIRWMVADYAVQQLEELRDEFTPKSPNDEWDDRFAFAVKMLPDARRAAEDFWWKYVLNEGR